MAIEDMSSSLGFWAMSLGLASLSCSAAGADVPSEPSGPPDQRAGSQVATGGAAGGQPFSGTSGASFAAGAGGSVASSTSVAGMGAQTVPFAGYDPAVTFEWPESQVTAGSCKAGRYQGAFTGNYVSPATGGGFVQIAVPVSGNVDLTLNESADGEFFVIANGTVAGVANFQFPFSSGLEGTLNCTTGKLEGGYLSAGKYNVWGVDYFYEGPVSADYDKLTNAFVNGAWQVGEPTMSNPPPPYGGAGVWGVNYAGP